MARIHTNRRLPNLTDDWKANGRPTPSAPGGVIWQAKRHFRATPGASAAYRGWTTRPYAADPTIHQYVCLQVERPGSALFHPWHRLRGYGHVTLFGVTKIGVRVKGRDRNHLVDVAI